MRLPSPFIRLPLLFDAEQLAAEVAQIPDDAWRPHPQGHPGNSALPLVARGGDVNDDGVQDAMQPTPYLAHCPYITQVLHALAAPVGRTRLMRIDANAQATPHVDTHYYWAERTRVHVPVLSFPSVRFLCGDAQTVMAPGEAWIFDTWRQHNVINPDSHARIHLVVDTVGSAPFWQLLAPPTRLRHVPFVQDARPQLMLESYNSPSVMCPWEIEHHLAVLKASLQNRRRRLRLWLSSKLFCMHGVRCGRSMLIRRQDRPSIPTF